MAGGPDHRSIAAVMGAAMCCNKNLPIRLAFGYGHRLASGDGQLWLRDRLDTRNYLRVSSGVMQDPAWRRNRMCMWLDRTRLRVCGFQTDMQAIVPRRKDAIPSWTGTQQDVNDGWLVGSSQRATRAGGVPAVFVETSDFTGASAAGGLGR